MILKNSDPLISRLEELVRAGMEAENAAGTAHEKACAAAYTKGLKDALAVVISHKRHGVQSAGHTPGPGQSDTSDKTPRLCQMDARDIIRLRLAEPDTIRNSDFSQAELTEAAFTFENELMTRLGDANTIPLDAYTELSETQLAGIIKNCTEKIVQLEEMK